MLSILVYPNKLNQLKGEVLQFNDVTSYTHTKTTTGGCDSANFVIPIKPDDAARYFQAIGCTVEVSYKGEGVWGGIVDNVSLNLNNIQLSYGSYFDIFNDVTVKYNNRYTANAQDQESIMLYGLRKKLLSSDTKYSVVADTQRDKFLLENKKLKPEIQSISNTTGFSTVTFSCKGFGYLLDYMYDDTSTTIINLSDKVQLLIDSEPNGFFDDLSQEIQINTLSVYQGAEEPVQALTELNSLVSMGGDTNNDPVMWEFKYNGDFYYRTIDDTSQFRPAYFVSTDGINFLDSYGSIIEPASIEPGRFLYLPQINVFTPTDNVNPNIRAIFVETVNYTYPNQYSITSKRQTTLSQYMSKFGLGSA